MKNPKFAIQLIRFLLKIYLPLVLIASFIAACEEENPGVIFTEPEKPLLDTSYVRGSIPAAQNKNVLLFDITGVRCNNCPKAAELAHVIDLSNSGRVVVMAVFPFAPGPFLTGAWPGYDTMTTQDAESMILILGNVASLPTGAVDQVISNSIRFIPLTDWTALVNSRLALTTPINIEIKNSWNAALKKGRAEIKITCTQNISDEHLLMIAVMESNIVGKQSESRLPSGHKDDYVFNHALRKLYTLHSGDSLKQNLTLGRVFEKHYSISPRYNWDPKELTVVVWVINANTKEVVHVVEEKLIP